MNSPSDILTPLQQKVLDLLFKESWFQKTFYLTGGTGLAAFYLFHRYSEDLDFFTHEEDLFPVEGVMQEVGKKNNLSIQQIQKSPYFLRYLVEGELKVDVVGDIPFRVEVPFLKDGIVLDTLKNIAVNKVCAILGRWDSKDYVDLYFILKEHSFDIFELLSLGQQKDGGLEPFVWADLIAGVKNFRLLPRMIKPVSLQELQDFFLKLRDQILDGINPLKK